MIDFIETTLNIVGAIAVSAALFEWGLCRLQKRKFSKANFFTFCIILFAVESFVTPLLKGSFLFGVHRFH